MKRFTLLPLVALLLFSISTAGFAASLPYIGNKTTKVYHTAECTWGQKIDFDNRIYFNSRENAENRGYRRCHYCGDDLVEPGHGGSGGIESNENKNNAESQNTNNNPTNNSRPISEEESKISHGIHPLFLIIVGVIAIWLIAGMVRSYMDAKKQEKIIDESNKAVLNALGVRAGSIPKGIVLLPDGTPTIGPVNSLRPYGGYTVYITPHGQKFHKSENCCRNWRACHIYKIPKGYTPCRNCASSMSFPISLPKWYLEITSQINKTPEILGECPRKGETNQAPSAQCTDSNRFDSSFIASAEYSNGTLYLTFANGSRYAYQNVPKAIYDELLEVPSKGKFFHDKISGTYPYYIPK